MDLQDSERRSISRITENVYAYDLKNDNETKLTKDEDDYIHPEVSGSTIV
jgi:hypothetical protein